MTEATPHPSKPLPRPQGQTEPDSTHETRLITTPVRALIQRAPVQLSPGATIQQAAQLMQQHRVSSVLLVEGGQLVGVVTDRDLRNRVVAQALDVGRPVAEIATPKPYTIDVGSPALDALLLMARHQIHHVPVVDGSTVVGMVSATDVTEQHNHSAVVLAGAIRKQTTLEGLVACAAQVKQLQRSLAAADASAYHTGRIVTAMTDALTVRLLELAEAELGPPPVPYAWLAAGSQARNEQTAKSDQDNCLLMDDAYDAALHGDYFRALSRQVCDGLDACGYIHCPGEMMAMTDAWRQPLRQWKAYFEHWIRNPKPQALMLTCVFFDQRRVYGSQPLFDELRAEVQRLAKDQRIFLAYMVSIALTHKPPLNFMNRIAPLRSGEHKGKLDLKMGGIVPIVDLARVYALAGGLSAVNTYERLQGAAASGEISAQSARDLREALEYLAGLRIRHQAQRMEDGYAADNFLRSEDLSNFERGHLRAAFKVVRALQEVLETRYQPGRL